RPAGGGRPARHPDPAPPPRAPRALSRWARGGLRPRSLRPARRPVIREFSAGGLVIRRFRGRPFVATVLVKDGTVHALPKGNIEKDESGAEAATREVRE